MTDRNYLLLGPELGEKKEFIENIKKKLADKFGSPAEEYSFYPFDSEMGNIISILQNVSLFSPAKLVIINNCDEIKKKDLPILLEYLKKPAEDSCLILASGNIKADAKFDKLIPSSNKKIFWEMFESRKKSWIQNFFRKEKIKIENSAVEFLNDIIENNTEILAKECSSLIHFFDAEDVITEEKIETFFYDRKEENLFSLFARLVSCDLQRSIEASKNIFLSGESNPVQIFGGLLWQLRNLHEIKVITERTKSFQEACQAAKIRGKKMQNTYQAGIKNYTREEIEALISMTAEYDAFFRTVKQDIQYIMFPVYIYYFIERKGKGAVSLLNSPA